MVGSGYCVCIATGWDTTFCLHPLGKVVTQSEARRVIFEADVPFRLIATFKVNCKSFCQEQLEYRVDHEPWLISGIEVQWVSIYMGHVPISKLNWTEATFLSKFFRDLQVN
ncbi:hypothetical protein TNCT_37071 [Trichonephila clavata]|uniref:Uncharacterized protein n=1 Tax=Trichonephila clavata TaxID=2740835 RepID=A0A8X6KZY4_TRICU|nr:hypothetical protein TNCT_37071 [Trichonephila clavata]